MKLRFPLLQVFRRTVSRVIIPLFMLSALAPAGFAQGVTIRFAGDSDVGEGGRWTRRLAEEWAKSTGNKLEYISRPNDASETLQQFQQYWAAKSSDVDAYMIDVIWPGICAPHAVDLKKYLKEDEIKAHFSRIIENNTVGGQLVGLPFFSDAGMLYYRTDLLEKYGFKGPPATWEELATQAKTIQDGERKAGQRDFNGFVFQGKASESVTCNAVEWIYSYGGGTVIDSDKKITINNPQAIKALETARSWVGTISPKGVTTYGEEEARNIWQGGHAAFMRNWPYAYALGADPKSAIAGKFAITVLPKGGENGKHAATLGGWQLMVSKYSKHPEVAADLVRYLCSPEAQKKRALELSQIPTRPALYSDPDILAKTPWFKDLLPVLDNAVARPSTVTGAAYNQVSTAIFQNVNTVLSGGSTPEKAVQQIERTARRVVK
ncbi:MAG TPA: ABC transporter substrate-binding protein [Chthoniobacterales bacterium]